MAPRRKCPTCGSRQWHKEPSSGLIACSEGHILQNYRNETTEITEAGPHAMKKRTLKSGKKKKGKKSNADPKLYHGARGRYHYFLCLQFIFRNQVETLMKLWQLPKEFESLCRDLWALYLDLMPVPISPEPYNFAQQETSGNGRKDKTSAKRSLPPEAPSPSSTLAVEGQEDANHSADECTSNPTAQDETGNDSEFDSESDSDSSPDEANKEEIERLMRDNSEIDDSDEEQDEDGAQASKSGKRDPGKRSRSRSRLLQHLYEGPANTIAVLVLACWTFRVPIVYRDFSRVIESYELPYLDPVRLLPQAMVKHLTKHAQQALSPHSAPGTLLLHKLTSRLAQKLHSTFFVFTPEVNAGPVLWRVVQALGGTPTLYKLTKRVASVLSLPLALRPSLASAALAKHRPYDPNGHMYDNAPPEVCLMASCVIALKMVYGLDGTERTSREELDPACALPSREAFLKRVRGMVQEDAKRAETLYDTQSTMRLEDLDDEMTDGYLSFCEKALLGNSASNDVLDNFFPLGNDHTKGHVGRDEGKTCARERLAAGRVQEGDVGLVRPGQEYKIWNARDVLGALPGEYALVVDRAAGWAGVPREYMEGVIEMYEKRVFRWYERGKRKSRGQRGEWSSGDDRSE